MHELSHSFVFEAAHTLRRGHVAQAAQDASRRIHGHSYRATVTITGEPDVASGTGEACSYTEAIQ